MTVDQHRDIATEPVEAPAWVHEDADFLTGRLTANELEGLKKVRTILWQHGEYDLPSDLITEAHEIDVEGTALLPLVQRLVDRWLEFERSVATHFRGFPEIDQLLRPTWQIPERRMAGDAIEAIGDVTNYDMLSRRTHATSKEVAQ